MDLLETRELSYFLAVADELHFGRAAERIGIAQPPLSRAISRLERRLGVMLFRRTSRRVELTEAGEVFRTETRATLRALERAVQRTQSAARPRLRVAAVPGTASGHLRALLAAYSGDPVEHVFTVEPAGALRSGAADAALLCDSEDLTGLDFEVLGTEAPIALVPAGHPLTRHSRVSTSQLRRDPSYAADCPAVGLDQIIDRVALGRLVLVVGDGVRDRLGDAVVAVPVTDLPVMTIVLAWPEGLVDRRTAAFVRSAATYTAAERVHREAATISRTPRPPNIHRRLEGSTRHLGR